MRGVPGAVTAEINHLRTQSVTQGGMPGRALRICSPGPLFSR
jgi:hypothetical protein